MLISMLILCFYAGSKQNMLSYFGEEFSNPWFVATLMDCYWVYLFSMAGWSIRKELVKQNSMAGCNMFIGDDCRFLLRTNANLSA